MCAADMSLEGVAKREGSGNGVGAVTGWGMSHRECRSWVSSCFVPYQNYRGGLTEMNDDRMQQEGLWKSISRRRGFSRSQRQREVQ